MLIWTSMTQFKILQCNLNHSWGAYGLLQQNMLEQNYTIAIIAEPVCIP